MIVKNINQGSFEYVNEESASETRERLEKSLGDEVTHLIRAV